MYKTIKKFLENLLNEFFDKLLKNLRGIFEQPWEISEGTLKDITEDIPRVT